MPGQLLSRETTELSYLGPNCSSSCSEKQCHGCRRQKAKKDKTRVSGESTERGAAAGRPGEATPDQGPEPLTPHVSAPVREGCCETRTRECTYSVRTRPPRCRNRSRAAHAHAHTLSLSFFPPPTPRAVDLLCFRDATPSVTKATFSIVLPAQREAFKNVAAVKLYATLKESNSDLRCVPQTPKLSIQHPNSRGRTPASWALRSPSLT